MADLLDITSASRAIRGHEDPEILVFEEMVLYRVSMARSARPLP